MVSLSVSIRHMHQWCHYQCLSDTCTNGVIISVYQTRAPMVSLSVSIRHMHQWCHYQCLSDKSIDVIISIYQTHAPMVSLSVSIRHMHQWCHYQYLSDTCTNGVIISVYRHVHQWCHYQYLSDTCTNGVIISVYQTHAPMVSLSVSIRQEHWCHYQCLSDTCINDLAEHGHGHSILGPLITSLPVSIRHVHQWPGRTWTWTQYTGTSNNVITSVYQTRASMTWQNMNTHTVYWYL